MEDNFYTYRIHIPQFEGPFDLLLFFIERDELDIHDIPIAKITVDFLDYIQQMQSKNIELAAEFILVASTLMRIKAKMLLPRPVLNEEGEEIDPREELVKRLLEYKRYKSVLDQLKNMEETQSLRLNRGNIAKEEKKFMSSEYPEEELIGMDLYVIMRTFKRIWEKHQNQLAPPKHVIRKYPYQVEEVRKHLLVRIGKEKRVDFVTLILEHPEKIYVIFCFLALLDLVQRQHLAITVGDGYNNFWLSPKEAPPAEAKPSPPEKPEESS